MAQPSIARRAAIRAASNLSSARKFAQKLLALFSTPDAVKLLKLTDSEAALSYSSRSSGGSSSSAVRAAYHHFAPASTLNYEVHI
jgi:DnaJ family protein B protein 12